MLTESEWSDLLVQAVGGNSEALDWVLLECQDELLRMLKRRFPAALARATSPEDLIQEAYADAMRGISRFHPAGSSSFKAWLGTIARNRLRTAIRAHRTAKRGGGAPVDERAARSASDSGVVSLLELVACRGRTPSGSAAAHEAAERVHRALNDLPPQYREAIEFRYLQSLSVPQVAQRMNRTEGAVAMLCNRALKALAASLGSADSFLSAG